MTTGTSKIITLFYSYAQQDKMLRDELDKHLDTLKRSGQIKNWHDREISPGVEWKKEIDTFLNSADIILLLVSPDFMASDYCYGVEMDRAMHRHTIGDARVIPVLLRPVGYEDAPFSKLQSLPTNGQPITSWSNRDEAFADVAKGIRKAIKEILTKREDNFQRENRSSQRTKEQWLDMGYAHYQAQKYQEALQAYQQALLLDPHNGYASLYSGHALKELKRYEEALAAYDQALQLDSTDIDIRLSRVEVLMYLKRYHEAIACCELILQADPSSLWAYIHKGHALRSLRYKLKESLAAYEQALQIEPTFEHALVGKAYALYDQRRYREALQAFEEATQRGTTDSHVYHFKGKVLEQLGRMQEAQEAYDKAKELGF